MPVGRPCPLLEGIEKFVMSFLAVKPRKENQLQGFLVGRTPKPVSEKKPNFSWNKSLK